MEEQTCDVQSFFQRKEFYEDAVKYWDEIPATVDGMLGGFGYISHIDIMGSKKFLKKLFNRPDVMLGRQRALDCGAGIGRISGNLLSRFFATVDLVEQNPKFLDQAKQYLKRSSSNIGEFYALGLQDFCPEPEKYDVIWAQWVLIYLNDDDLIKFFKNCKQGLKKNGLLIIKENVTNSDEIDIDKQDSSVTRPKSHFLKAFDKTGFKCIKEEKQTNMPDGLYPVFMFALKPCDIES